jgi:site-specific recombinase XerD
MIGIKSIKFHALRACFATHMLNEGISLTTVMKIAGWKELGTVQKYTRLSGIHERGATDCLERFIPPTFNENIVQFSKNG